MPLDSSQDTTSEWLERALMLVGVALFFTALLITGPLTGLLGVLDDPGDGSSALTDDANDTAESSSSEDAITATPGTDEAGDSSGERTRSDNDEAAASGDGEDEESDDDAEREEEREDEADEEDEDDDDDQDDDDDDDDDDDEEDGPPGEARGHDDDRGNGNGRGRG